MAEANTIIMKKRMAMVDIHCHLLFGVDDGSKSIEESIKGIRDLKELGYTDIILTPHYIKDSNYSSTKKENLRILKTLVMELKKANIDINLYLGNEIYMDDDINELLKKEEISSLNNTDYLLIELPMSGEYKGYIEIFEYLLSHNYKVILAHPERYFTFQKDFNKVLELEKMGILFQSNLESIVGRYGKSSQKLVKKLLKENKITFLATDLHHPKKDYDAYAVAKKKIIKYIGEARFNQLTSKNAKMLIQ